MVDKVNPFSGMKKPTNWAQKAQSRLEESTNVQGENKTSEVRIQTKKTKAKPRVAKSFKLYPGDIIRTFDKRVNKLQVHFDDLDYDKNYVDSGKYMMFLMSLAEEFELFELYEEVDSSGKLSISKEKLKEVISKKLN